MRRFDVFYRGSVQGVGFRYTAQSFASSYAITGYVRNLADGRVHVVVEGGDEEIEDFLGQIRSRLGHYIRDEKMECSPATGEFEEFGIEF